jgi:NAD+ synthase (glutamine-hydrolysing)
MVSVTNQTLAELFANLPADTTEENIQSRCRGLLLMAISNKTRRMVLATGNKSEMAVGYATLYGDMNGGFAPIKDCTKTLVYQLARYRNSLSDVIPERVLSREPSAELAPDQRDSDSLPPYEVLDPILDALMLDNCSSDDIVARGFDPEIVAQIVAIVRRNEYKRRQAAPGVRISARAFGRDWRYPITSGYR